MHSAAKEVCICRIIAQYTSHDPICFDAYLLQNKRISEYSNVFPKNLEMKLLPLPANS